MKKPEVTSSNRLFCPPNGSNPAVIQLFFARLKDLNDWKYKIKFRMTHRPQQKPDDPSL